jgi:hypothetical protein
MEIIVLKDVGFLRILSVGFLQGHDHESTDNIAQ